MPIRFSADFGGAIRKTQELLAIPSAFKKVITGWGSDTIKILKRSAAGLQKSPKHPGGGALSKNIGMDISQGGESSYKIALGTGVGGTKSVVYARIQDEGGTIHSKGKKLTVPFPGVQGTIANHPGGRFIKVHNKTFYILQTIKKVRGKWTAPIDFLYILKDEVTLPPTNWFSGPMAQRIAYLEAMATPEYVLEEARKIAALGGSSGKYGQMD